VILIADCASINGALNAGWFTGMAAEIVDVVFGKADGTALVCGEGDGAFL